MPHCGLCASPRLPVILREVDERICTWIPPGTYALSTETRRVERQVCAACAAGLHAAEARNKPSH